MNCDGDAKKPKVCILLPTFNNCPTVSSVIEEVSRFVERIIVVNDGSTDGTTELLEKNSRIDLIHLQVNQGKGAALARGFDQAMKLGFTHAISMDADGQHLASDLPKMLDEIHKNPDSLVIGVRRLSGHGRAFKSRILRRHSNFWVWAETGQWINDSQSGFRAYPLEAIAPLYLKTKKYDFEIEVLVKAIWWGIPMASAPVQAAYGPGSRSHFRPFKDFALVSILNASLFLKSLFVPAPLRRLLCLQHKKGESRIQRFLGLCHDVMAYELEAPSRFALSVGLGFFMGIIPIWGFQTAAAYVAARNLRLSGNVSLVASNISFPVAIPFIIYGSLLLGHLALSHGTELPRYSETDQSVVGNHVCEYLVGSFLLALLIGAAGVLVSYFFAKAISIIKEKRV